MNRCASSVVFFAFTASLAMVHGQQQRGTDRHSDCDKISPHLVWDVQWSGNFHAQVENPFGFDFPFNPLDFRRVRPDSTDYFRLTREEDSKYQLKLFASDGTVKMSFPPGEVKANSDVVFYVVQGFYGTIITKNVHQRAHSASMRINFSGLVVNPSQEVIAQALGSSCLGHANEEPIIQSMDFIVKGQHNHTQRHTDRHEECDKISPDRVWDVQWSGNPTAEMESPSFFSWPVDPNGRRRVKPDSTDYFTLKREADGKCQLKLFASNGTVKTSFPPGKVKANSDVVFYIIDDWFGTIIAKEAYQHGDRAHFPDLVSNPSHEAIEDALGSSCLVHANDVPVSQSLVQGAADIDTATHTDVSSILV